MRIAAMFHSGVTTVINELAKMRSRVVGRNAVGRVAGVGLTRGSSATTQGPAGSGPLRGTRRSSLALVYRSLLLRSPPTRSALRIFRSRTWPVTDSRGEELLIPLG